MLDKVRLVCHTIMDFQASNYSKYIHNGCTKFFCSDIVGTKGNNDAAAVLVDVDDSTEAKLEEHIALTESVEVQIATQTGPLVAETAY